MNSPCVYTLVLIFAFVLLVLLSLIKRTGFFINSNFEHVYVSFIRCKRILLIVITIYIQTHTQYNCAEIHSTLKIQIFFYIYNSINLVYPRCLIITYDSNLRIYKLIGMASGKINIGQKNPFFPQKCFFKFVIVTSCTYDSLQKYISFTLSQEWHIWSWLSNTINVI